MTQYRAVIMAYRQQIGATGPQGSAPLGGAGSNWDEDPEADTREEMRRIQTENVSQTYVEIFFKIVPHCMALIY